MARHILAACVVCLLCADHLPCQQHFDSISGTKNVNGLSNNLNNINPKFLNKNENHKSIINDNNKHSKNEDDIGLTIKDLENHPRLQAINIEKSANDDIFDLRNPYRNQIPINAINKLTNSEIRNLRRQRRHAGHDHGNENESDLEISPITKEFIKKIFLYYGEKGREMNLENFEIMMKRLKLNKLKYYTNSTATAAAAATTNSKSYNQNSSNSIQVNNHDNECASINELFEHLYPEVKENLKNEYEELLKENPEVAKKYEMADPVYKLTKNNIHSMCPILLYQILSKNPIDNEGCIQHKYLTIEEPKIDLDEITEEEYEKETHLIWVYSTLAVVLCGLLGLVGVAIIPFMQTEFYQQILSFLVALAVGTMTGDALLHLIPHSVVCSSEEDMVRKGLACVLGIIGFYTIENMFTLISEYRKKANKKSKAHSNSNVTVLRQANKNDDKEDGAGEKLCKGKYSTEYCYPEISMDGKDENHSENHDGHNHDNDKPLPVSVILREHVHSHHGHSHQHGHVHQPPTTISAVAWMIILGDGLHNFTDGMAIGAAFSESIPGGFSTSLAVFCHELPHELGDFAILIKAGMTPKAAVAYNCLTAILSFVGMIFGIVFGENVEASRWMFAVAAGLFIYIALVDMMPEMTSAHNTIKQIFLQLLGLIGGLMSMLLIALYEHELMSVFGGHNHSHGCPGGDHGHSHGHGHSH